MKPRTLDINISMYSVMLGFLNTSHVSCVPSPTKNPDFFDVSTLCRQCLHNVCMEPAEQCPACQRSITIQEGGVNAIPQNLHLGFDVEVAG